MLTMVWQAWHRALQRIWRRWRLPRLIRPTWRRHKGVLKRRPCISKTCTVRVIAWNLVRVWCWVMSRAWATWPPIRTALTYTWKVLRDASLQRNVARSIEMTGLNRSQKRECHDATHCHNEKWQEHNCSLPWPLSAAPQPFLALVWQLSQLSLSAFGQMLLVRSGCCPGQQAWGRTDRLQPRGAHARHPP